MEADKNISIGYLIVRVSTAKGAIPLRGAGVSVREYLSPGTVVESGITDGDGNTRTFDLPAPGFENSQTPNSGQSYSTYNISVSYQGYGTVFFSNVPVFPGITSIQQAYLVPLAEDGTHRIQNSRSNRYFYTDNTQL